MIMRRRAAIQLDPIVKQDAETLELYPDNEPIIVAPVWDEMTTENQLKNYAVANSFGATDIFAYFYNYVIPQGELENYFTYVQDNPDVSSEKTYNLHFEGFRPYRISSNGVLSYTDGQQHGPIFDFTLEFMHIRASFPDTAKNIVKITTYVKSNTIVDEPGVGYRLSIASTELYRGSRDFTTMGFLDGKSNLYVVLREYDENFEHIEQWGVAYFLFGGVDITPAVGDYRCFKYENGTIYTPTVNELTYQFQQRDPDESSNYIGELDISNVRRTPFEPVAGGGIPLHGLEDFYNMYDVTRSNLQKVFKCLWSDDWYDRILRLFNNPMDCLISLTMIPFAPDVTTTVNTIVTGNTYLRYLDGGEYITLREHQLTAQFKKVDFGTLSVKRILNNSLDYDIKLAIWLPFIGFKEIDVNDVMSKKLHLYYNIDCFTGVCVATLETYTDAFDGEQQGYKCIATYTGNCGQQIPLSGADYSQITLALARNVVSGAAAVATGNIVGAVGAAVNQLASSKPTYERTSSNANVSGFMSQRRAFLLYEIPFDVTPKQLPSLAGFAYNQHTPFTQGDGYYKCSEFHADNIATATEAEKSEIESLFLQGVIF